MSSVPTDAPVVTRAENAGLDAISESDRKRRPSDLFMFWFVANTSTPGLFWGARVLEFGLLFWQVVAAGSIGAIVSFLLCSVAAALSKWGSTPIPALSRTASGYNGNRLSVALSWILTVGWEVVPCVSVILASTMVFQALGRHNQIGARTLGFPLTVGLVASAGIFDSEAITRIQIWITWVTSVLTVIHLVLAAPQISTHRTLAPPSGDPAVFVGALITAAASFGLGWVNAAADYFHYLLRKALMAGVIGWTALGPTLPCVVLVFFGILPASFGTELSQATNTDPIGALTMILPIWLLIPLVITVTLGLADDIIMDLYSSGLSFLATGLPVHRHVATFISAIIMTVDTIAAIFGADDFLSSLQGFLAILRVVIIAWAGVMVAEVVLRRRDYNEEALFTPDGVHGSVNWETIILAVVDSVTGWGLVVNSTASWLSWQGYLLGPLGGRDEAWAGTNLGVLVTPLTGVLEHLALGRGRVTLQEARS